MRSDPVAFFPTHEWGNNAKEDDGESAFKFRHGRTCAGQNLYNPALIQGTQNDRLHSQNRHSEISFR
jgi:hypothetical protein